MKKRGDVGPHSFVSNLRDFRSFISVRNLHCELSCDPNVSKRSVASRNIINDLQR